VLPAERIADLHGDSHSKENAQLTWPELQRGCRTDRRVWGSHLYDKWLNGIQGSSPLLSVMWQGSCPRHSALSR